MVIAVPSVMGSLGAAKNKLNDEQENSIREAAQMLGIDLDDYVTDIYNCKDDSWIVSKCTKEDKKWVEVKVTVGDLIDNKYFDDKNGRCNRDGELTIDRASKGYNVTFGENVTCSN